MDDEDAPQEFPDVSQKLAAPKKLSAFEKERLAAEEKRRREQAETAAALAEFEDSFGGNEDFDGFPASARGPPAGPSRGYGGAPRGGLGGGPPRSGPGSLGPAAGPPPSIKRKRALDELREQQEVRREQEALAAEYNRASSSKHEAPRRRVEDDEDPEIAAPRPTVQLSNLPPSTTEYDVQALLSDHLKVHSVSISPPIRQGTLSVTAIALLNYDTSTPQIDTAVSALRDKYLGCGYRLMIARHLSSTALQPGALSGSVIEPEPFGAERINRDQPRGHAMRHAPPPGDFAPPDSYDVRPPRNGGIEAYAHVTIAPPLDIATVRAIHVIAERLLCEPDTDKALELEAVLMAMPEVEDDERFAFLYDSQSPEGLYYRYLLWSDDEHFDALQEQRRGGREPERLLDDVPIDWNVAPGEVPFMDLTKLGDVLEHFNYESSDDESDDGEERKFNTSRRKGEGPSSGDKKHLTPLRIAKFTWLLSRMPATHARLRLSDVAPITAFAINNAGAGAEEIVDMMVLNLEKPFGLTQCGKFDVEDPRQDDEDVYEPDMELPSIESNMNEMVGKERREQDTDPSQIKLVALYLINDILHNSSTAGVRNAWKYRQLFEAAFRRQHTFKTLGRLGKDMGWGRMKDQQWRNKIGVLFEIWERNSIFAADVFESLKKDFFEQPTETTDEDEEIPDARKVSALDLKHLAKFKRIDGIASPATAASASASPAPADTATAESAADDADHFRADDTVVDGLDGVAMDDLDGAALDDLDGAPLDDINGSPLLALDEAPAESIVATSAVLSPPPLPAPQRAKGAGFSLKSSSESKSVPTESARRKLAEDMFADSDED